MDSVHGTPMTEAVPKRIDLIQLPPPGSSPLNTARGPFTGNRLSLNFQDIEVRAVLQIADVAGLNLWPVMMCKAR